MIFAERYHWQNIDDMPLLERRRKLELVKAIADSNSQT